MSWLTVTSNGIVQWLQDRLAGNTAVWEGSTSQHSGQRSQHVSSREALKLQMLPLDVPLKQQQEPRALLQLPSSLPACHSASSSTKPSSTLRQSLTQAASKLSCKTVVDMNSGLCSTELAWHVRAQEQQQQPARMAVKVSNRHKTRVTFDAQVALGNTPGTVLRLAGSPQGMHAASVLIKPAGHAQGWSPITPADEAPYHNAESAARDMRHGQSSSSISSSRSSSSISRSSSDVTKQQGSRRRHPRQHGRIGSHSFGSSAHNTDPQPNASSASHQHHAEAPDAAQHHLAGSTAATTVAAVSAQVQWELGWNWKAAGPIASVTKQLSDSTAANNSSSSSTGGTVRAPPWQAVQLQQLKLAFDPKAHSYTLAAGGEGWSVMLAVPTKSTGLWALVPRVCQAGCRPKLTLSLLPDVCCF